MRALLALLASMALLSPSAASAQAAEAQLHFELANEYYAQGRYREALERYIASNRLVPNAHVVFNMASTYERLDRPIEAYNAYETFLVEFAHDAASERETGVRARDALASRVAVIEVTCEPGNAELHVDRADLGVVGRGSRRVAVEPGRRRIIARLEGYVDASAEADAVMGRVVTITLSLERMRARLEVVSTPVGATVAIEGGEVLGTTPLETELPVGEHRLTLRAPGHLLEHRTVTVGGAGSRIAVELRREHSVPQARVEVRGEPPGAVVSVGGNELGAAPFEEGSLAVGESELAVSAPGYVPARARVTFEGDRTLRARYRLVPASDLGTVLYAISYVAGGLTLLAGVGAGIRVLGLTQDLHSGRPEPRIDSSIVPEIATGAALADGLIFAGAALLLLTLVVDLADQPAPSQITFGD